MQSIVLDCNCLIQLIPKKSKYRIIWEKILKNEIVLCVTTEILNEYSEILSYYFSVSLSDYVLNTILNLRTLKKTEVYFNWNLITVDEDDNKYVDCAIAANAELLVTEDNHFKILKTIAFPQVKCIKLDNFLKTMI